MTEHEKEELTVGDLVRHVSGDGKAFVVTGNYRTHVTAVRTVDITNASEWVIVSRAHQHLVK